MLKDEPVRYLSTFRDVSIASPVLKHDDTNRKRTSEQKREKHAKDDKEKEEEVLRVDREWVRGETKDKENTFLCTVHMLREIK